MYPHDTKGSRSSRAGTVLLVGVGALGCPAAMVLARTPLLRLTLVDPDRVELSNLQRQPLFDERAIGSLKVEIAAARLRAHGLAVEALPVRLDRSNAEDLIARHDFVIDACDDPATKFLINSVAARMERPSSYGGVTRTSGLSMMIVPHVTACLECVFGTDGPGTQRQSAPSASLGCQDLGVLAPVAGVIGSLQATHALAALGLGPTQPPGRLIAYELRDRRWRVMRPQRDPRCGACCGEASVEDRERRIEPCRS